MNMSIKEILKVLNDNHEYEFSKNLESLQQDEERLLEKLDEYYIAGFIDEDFYKETTANIQGMFNKQRNDVKTLNIAQGDNYINNLTGSHPSTVKAFINNPDGTNETINKTEEDIENEREQTLATLYEQFVAGKIKQEELLEKENRINMKYNNLVENLPNNRTR